MKELILDIKKWRCGGNHPIIKTEASLGEGETFLKNDEGYMCCLGQFAVQLEPSIKEDDLIGVGNPEDILNPDNMKILIPGLTLMVPFNIILGEKGKTRIANTEFSNCAIGVNDNPHTSIEEKIQKLTELCEKYDFKLKVINKD